jgi:hypothetical protein
MSDDDREDFDPNDDQYADEDALYLSEGALPDDEDDDAATAAEYALAALVGSL